MATQLGQVIEIYDLKKERVVERIGLDEGAPRFENRGGYAVPTGIMGYSDVHVGQEHIYTLFWSTSFEEIRKRPEDRKSTRLNSSHVKISYAVFCLKKKKRKKSGRTPTTNI